MKTLLSLAVALVASTTLGAQTPTQPAPQPPPQPKPAAPAQPAPAKPAPAPASPSAAPGAQTPDQKGVEAPADYVIGPDDLLGVIVWREQDLSTDVKVRPDGKVSLPLLNDIQAAGLTPEQFRKVVTTAATKFVADPNVTIIVKQINSRMVFVMGEVGKPGTYPLTTSDTTVLQLLAHAGGPTPFAKKDQISVVRTVNGKTTSHRFNLEDVLRGRRMEQNLVLRPGDTIMVP